MNSRRALIVVLIAGVFHNALRVIASILGTQWDFFNYLKLRRTKPLDAAALAEIAGVIAVALAAAWIARAAWHKTSGSSPLWSSAMWAVLAACLPGLLMVYVSTSADRTYGWVLFVVTPFLMGLVSVLVLARSKVLSAGDVILVSILSVALLGAILLALAIEGIICLGMAIPLAMPIALAGGFLGYAFQRRTAARSPVAFLLIASLAPFGATIERVLQPPAELFAVTTSIEIPVSRERVWQTVLQPARLAPPSQFLFRAGVAYPLASHIEGTGLAATRYCDFSTGKLVEPVLIWDEPKQLRFRVASNPLPMQEWTPYARIHPPHLEGFLVSRQGEFLLEPLPGGGTRLTATTWYQHHLWPSRYWRAWSDHIIHQVHEMVLENVRDRALAYK